MPFLREAERYSAVWRGHVLFKFVCRRTLGRVCLWPWCPMQLWALLCALLFETLPSAPVGETHTRDDFVFNCSCCAAFHGGRTAWRPRRQRTGLPGSPHPRQRSVLFLMEAGPRGARRCAVRV